MINNFQLSKLEERQMRNDINSMLRVNQFELSYNDYVPIINEEGGWSDYALYYCQPEEVSELTIKKYSNFAIVETGDLVLMLPSDTTLPLDKSKYKINYNGKDYICQGDITAGKIINSEPLYYIGVFKL